MNPEPLDPVGYDTQCKESAGFLFSHACENAVTGTCAMCGKNLCNKHQRTNEKGVVCIGCAKKTAANTNGRYSDYDNDPYFYSYNSYNGYGYYGGNSWGSNYHHAHPHRGRDFTAADGESMRDEGDEGFERSLQES